MASAKQVDEAKRSAEDAQNTPAIQGLAAYVRSCWSVARDEKEQSIEPRMHQSLRQRNGLYDPEKLALIKAQGGSEIYMLLTSAKCRGAAAWIKDILIGSGSDKPWSIEPTPVPDLPPQIIQYVAAIATAEAQRFMFETGVQPTPDMMWDIVSRVKDRIHANTIEQATKAAKRTEQHMEDQLIEGGFLEALDDFVEDLVTFPAAIVKGPVVMRRKQLKWAQGAQGWEAQVSEELKPQWRRVSPLDIYPSPGAVDTNDGFLFERHRLTRAALLALKGTEGYDDAAIDAVIEEYGRGGLREWIAGDTSRAEAENRTVSGVMANKDRLIDALQFWGSVSGQDLLDWGVPEEQVADALAEYEAEVWLIGRWVIKATLNPDPMGDRGYYKASFEKVPGAFWGNAPPDLIRDIQDACNAAARALINNMGIASGPQVWINVDRMPPGEKVTNLFPWKIHQGTSDPMGSTAKAIEFFQPDSRAAELMQVYEYFSNKADEYSSIPRYAVGDLTGTSGALRTASGASMMMGNAGKMIKQVIGSIDRMMNALLTKLYGYNMRFGPEEIKGDVRVRVRGVATALVKETAQVRRNEFLQLTANPIDMQIMGLDGRAALLRTAAETLDMDTDKVVPPVELIRARLQAQAQAAAMMEQQPSEEISIERDGEGAMTKAKVIPKNRQRLMNGAPVTDNFQPMRQN
jgi:hypothetical protein